MRWGLRLWCSQKIPAHGTEWTIAIRRAPNGLDPDAEAITSSHDAGAGNWCSALRWGSNRELRSQTGRAPAAAPKQHAMQRDSLIAMGVKGAPPSNWLRRGWAFSWPRSCRMDIPCRDCISPVVEQIYWAMHNSLPPLHTHLCSDGLRSQSLPDHHHEDKSKASQSESWRESIVRRDRVLCIFRCSPTSRVLSRRYHRGPEVQLGAWQIGGLHGNDGVSSCG
jgi:hypothetical protein